ncbi:glutathione S-transferase T3-like [Panicum hallii]|uniref:glutathione S-transferase T3-like n=1 Tax=Panicum hallii TaxID=206008 RepID=UPI000DF4D16C|nr:glutathione S-transferase T3-like [Panicum hallii]
MEYGQSGEEDLQELFHHNDGASSHGVPMDDVDIATAAQCNNMQKGKKRVVQKNVARRGFAFTKEEDAVLCSAYLNISKDAIVGVNQNMGAYWKRIYDYYSEHKPNGSIRSQIGLQKRWGAIQKAVSTFSACKSKVDRRNESGKNEYDRIEDAVKMYEQKEPFQFMHCWKILRYEAKWNDKLLEVNSTRNVRKEPAASEPVVTQGANDPVGDQGANDPLGQQGASDPLERPEGRDSAKRRRAKEESASSNAAVEVLQQIHQKNELTEVKQDAQMQEILSLKGDKMKLTQQMFDLHKHDIEVRNKYKEEQLNLTKQDIEVRAKQSEAQLLTAELGIMGADLDKLSPQVRSYYITMQQEIMKRRGIGTSQNSDGA